MLRLKTLQPLYPLPSHHEAGTRGEVATTCTGSIGLKFPLVIGLPEHKTYRANNIRATMAIQPGGRIAGRLNTGREPC